MLKKNSLLYTLKFYSSKKLTLNKFFYAYCLALSMKNFANIMTKFKKFKDEPHNKASSKIIIFLPNAFTCS